MPSPATTYDAAVRDALARALWFREAYWARVRESDWEDARAWYEREVAAGRSTADSRVGGCMRRAEKALRWIEAAGLTIGRGPTL